MSINLYSYSTHFKYHFYADDSQVYHVSQISLPDSTPISNFQLDISLWTLTSQELETQ